MFPFPIYLIEILLPFLFIAFFLLFFLPAIVELKRPRDAGPRRIMNVGLSEFKTSRSNIGIRFLLDLEDIEKREFTETHLGVTMQASNPIFVLANIEV